MFVAVRVGVLIRLCAECRSSLSPFSGRECTSLGSDDAGNDASGRSGYDCNLDKGEACPAGVGRLDAPTYRRPRAGTF